MSDKFKRISPEEALKVVQQESKGHLKIFLGYAPGVGKTFTMLNEANRRLKRGDDIVIGYLESHGRSETDSQISLLETLSRKNIEHNGITMSELDVEAVIIRKPSMVLIDELAHTNVPGSKNNKRYEDVQEILDKGINVLTTLNIQHLESLNDVVKQITGITVRETIPDMVVENADEVVVVDITPDALQNRLKRGDIYKPENVDRALKNFFRKGNLNALREIALRHIAEEVDEELEEYMKEHDIHGNWYTAERVLVCISTNPFSRKLIRRGARISKRYKCEWTVVNVDCTHIFASRPNIRAKELLENHFKLAKQLGAETVRLTGKSVSRELANFASEKHITQIVIGHAKRAVLQTIVRGSTVTKLLRHAKDIEIHVVPDNF